MRAGTNEDKREAWKGYAVGVWVRACVYVKG